MRMLTLSDLPVTIEKLRYLLSKATAVFGDRAIGELTSQEVAAWRMTLSPGYRFEATQALRQVLHRAVARGCSTSTRPRSRRQPLPARVSVEIVAEVPLLTRPSVAGTTPTSTSWPRAPVGRQPICSASPTRSPSGLWM